MNSDRELQLNAYIDGELAGDEREAVLRATGEDPDLARDLCELRHTKELLRLAYEQPPQASKRPRLAGGRTRFQRLSLVATLLVFTLGGVIGWFAHTPSGPPRFVLLDPDGGGAAPVHPGFTEMRIVIHLTNPDQTVVGDLLDEVEALLIAYRVQGRPLRVEIVGHGQGLGLLRKRLSRHKGRIAALAEGFDNLTFVACQNTIDRLRVEQGVEVRLLPQAQVTRSGVTYVLQRKRQGWAYIKV
jgi:intracellular sulfur oxidation DsrE/DsrF family protein